MKSPNKKNQCDQILTTRTWITSVKIIGRSAVKSVSIVSLLLKVQEM